MELRVKQKMFLFFSATLSSIIPPAWLEDTTNVYFTGTSKQTHLHEEVESWEAV